MTDIKMVSMSLFPDTLMARAASAQEQPDQGHLDLSSQATYQLT